MREISLNIFLREGDGLFRVFSDVPFKPQMTRAVIDKDRELFRYYLNPKVFLEFRDIEIPFPEIGKLKLTDALNEGKCLKDGLRALSLKGFKEDMFVRHYFFGKRRSIHLKEEDALAIEAMLSNTGMNAEVVIFYDGVESQPKDIPSEFRADIMRMMDEIDIISVMSPIYHSALTDVKHYKKIAKRSAYNKGGESVSTRKKQFGKLILGGAVLAVGAIVSVVGIGIAKGAADVLTGWSKEVVLVEDDYDKKFMKE